VAGHPGINKITSSASANSGAVVSTVITSVTIAGGEVAELVFKTPAAILATTTIKFGYHDATTSALPVDGVYFLQVGTSIEGAASAASNQTVTGDGYTLAVDTWYRLKLVVNDDADRVDFYIYDMSGAELWTNHVQSNIPTAAGRTCGYVVVATDSAGGTAELIQLDAMAFYGEKDIR
jgi:hypothetical protein